VQLKKAIDAAKFYECSAYTQHGLRNVFIEATRTESAIAGCHIPCKMHFLVGSGCCIAGRVFLPTRP